MDIVGRAQRIILKPREEWPVIDGEQTSVGALYKSYIAILAAIGPIAAAIGEIVFGVSVPFAGSMPAEPVSALVSAVVAYCSALIGVYVFALIIDNLAPSFGGTRSRLQALKVAAFSSTPVWLAGVFAILPGLAILGILGLYSLYLLYLGLPVLMKTPPERALGYTAVSIIVAIVLFVLIGLIIGAITAALLVPTLGP
jgi:hypothetical protein